MSDCAATISISGDAQAASGPHTVRADQALPARIGADRRRQHAGDRRDRAVESEFAQNGEAGNRVLRNGADRRHQAERDRQIVMAAFLGQIGGREIDGDAARRQREAGGDQRGAHALFGFRHRLVGQADDVEGGQAGRDLHLHVDGAGLDALEGDGRNALDHNDAPHPDARQSSGRLSGTTRTIRERTNQR